MTRAGYRSLLSTTALLLAPAAWAALHGPVTGTADPNEPGVVSAAAAVPAQPVVVPRMPGPRRNHALGAAAGRSTLAPPLSPLQSAPILAGDFAGIPFTSFFPPDPSLAVGPDDLVAVVNGAIALFTRSGANPWQRSLNNFFNGSQSSSFVYDPKVIFDPHSGRFFVAAIDGQNSPNSWLRLAVSKSSAPSNLSVSPSATSQWWGYNIDADRDGGAQINNNWADFPGVGVDQYNLYITANMFDNDGGFHYVKVWVIAKAALLNGGPPTVFEFGAPPAPALGNPETGEPDFTITPALNFDSGSEHMLSTNELAGGDGFLTLWTVNDPGGTPLLASANLTVAAWNGFTVPPCAQAGGGTPLDAGDTRVLNAVERDGSLWATHTQPSADGLRAEVRWYEIDVAGPTLRQSGLVSDATRCYFYPAIMPDAQGNAGLVMSGVDEAIFGSVFYTGRLAADAAGTMPPVATLRAGLSSYVRTDAAGFNRWGDYGGIAADPAGGELWIFHEYASHAPDLWDTWLGRLQFPTPAPSPTSTVAPTAGASVTPEPTPAATATASDTPLATSTYTASPTATDTATPMDTAAPVFSPTFTPTTAPLGPRGDANCDLRVSAADVSAVVLRLTGVEVASCAQADVDGNGQVTAADIAAVIERIFTAAVL
ncbi:MAG: hypothetical protein HY699_19105 [Deltaproteobacteria bacterium]|nr:hypothetical protein [Deltaproteobacteria bacterium]